MDRPAHLPDYERPPINEVVIGVQFRAPQTYQQIRAGEVWNLFRTEFPRVEEHQILAPTFETFGPLQPRKSQIELIQGAQHDRFWFISTDGDRLLQFQGDRLIFNWRNIEGKDNSYPRFERMIESFSLYLSRLNEYFVEGYGEHISINQVEVNYINHLDVGQSPELSSAVDYLRVLNFDGPMPDDVALRYRRVVRSADGSPSGRLYVETGVGITPAGREVATLSLTVRGSPLAESLDEAIKYIRSGRELIVLEFDSITSSAAHEVWRRIS